MIKSKLYLVVIVLLSVAFFTSNVYAKNGSDDDSSSSSSSSSKSSSSSSSQSECLPVQDCVDAAISSLVTQCALDDIKRCGIRPEKFVLSAGMLAERAIKSVNCQNKTTRRSCKQCYKKARQKIQVRNDTSIFRALFSQAVVLIDAEQSTVCNALP